MILPRFFRFVPALLVASTVAGCNSEPSGPFELPVVSTSKVKRDARVNGKEDGRPQLLLQHDFGILRPGQVVTHPFTIHNESSETWTFAQFGSDCSCTVANASARSIPPSGSAELEIQYDAGNRSRDDRREVVARFEEETAPLVVLEVRAQVREPLHLSTRQIVFSGMHRGEASEQYFEVSNYSDQSWNGISVRSSAEWLTFETISTEQNAENDLPRQVWIVVVQAKTEELSYERHKTTLEVTADSQGLPRGLVVVHAELANPVVAVPEVLFFGKVPSESDAKRTLGLRFSDGSVPKGTDAVALSHDLGDALTLDWTRTEGSLWELTVRIVANGQEGLVKGKIDVEFHEPNLPKLEIPVIARVGNP